MSTITIKRGVENKSITSVKIAGDALLKAMEVSDRWNDNTYERFKENVVEPVSCALDNYLEIAKDYYENLEAASVLCEHILKVCEEEVVNNEPRSLIFWARSKMFPRDYFDEMWNGENVEDSI